MDKLCAEKDCAKLAVKPAYVIAKTIDGDVKKEINVCEEHHKALFDGKKFIINTNKQEN